MDIPVKIRPHLVPFLFREFDGKEAKYNNRTAKSVIFLPSSSITSYLYSQVDYKKTNLRQDKFIFHLTVDSNINKIYKGQVYIDKSGIKEPLLMEAQKITDFNNLIEDMFRVSMIFYIDGCRECGLSVDKSIDKFIDKYDLLEVGLDQSSLRALYFRQKKTPNLYRFQSKSANRVANYF